MRSALAEEAAEVNTAAFGFEWRAERAGELLGEYERQQRRRRLLRRAAGNELVQKDAPLAMQAGRMLRELEEEARADADEFGQHFMGIERRSLLAENASAAASGNGNDEVVSRDDCIRMFGRRRYISDPALKKGVPPMLYTFPGSGNTWARLVLEFATGYYSGSVYTDKRLVAALPGELRCNRDVIVVKVHPHTHPYAALRNRQPDKKCASLSPFNRGVFIVRNPYDAVWSEYQRLEKKTHVGKVMRNEFNRGKFVNTVTQLAKMYEKMYSTDYHNFIRDHPDGYVLIKYEDLRDKATQLDAMQKVLQFLKFKVTNVRLRCAFLLSEHPDVHRKESPNAITKLEGYDKGLACRLWAIFGKAATAYGYGVFNDYEC